MRLSEYLVWTDDESVFDIKRAENIKHRTRLIVDERPAMLTLFNITKDSLNDIEAHVQRAANRELFAPIFQICSYIRSNCFVKPADLQNQYWDKCSAVITEAVEDYFYDKSSTREEILDIYVALKIFCTNGGFVNYSDESEFLNITVGKYINIFDKIFDAIVLDGTAKISSLYKNKKFNIVDLPAIKTYKNTSITVCTQLNGSLHEFENHHGILETVSALIWNQKPSDEDGLIITTKKQKEKFLAMGLPPRTSIDHFGNITGTNKYADIKFLYIVGIPYLQDNAYKIAYHTFSDDTDMNKEQRSIVINGARKLMDSDYRETADSIIAAELIQAINRVRCRKWEKGDTLHTHIFMLNKDLDVLNLIETSMGGVKITYDKEFYEMLPDEVREKKPVRALDAVLSILSDHKNLFDSNKVSKKKIFESHGITMNLSDVTKAGIWKKPAILQLVSDGKIRVAGKYIEFLE